MNAPVECRRCRWLRALRNKGTPEKIIRVLFPKLVARCRVVQKVMRHGRSTARPVRVKKRQVAQKSGYRG